MALSDRIQAHKTKLTELALDNPGFKTWIKQVEKMENVVLAAENVVHLKHNPVIKEFIDISETANIEIDKRLSTERDMTDKERSLLFAQNDWNKQFLGLFRKKELILKGQEKLLKQVINNMKKHGH